MGKATREAYGNALARIGKENTNIIVLDADLSKSTKTDTFKNVCPDRFFNVGIAEQNLIWCRTCSSRQNSICFFLCYVCNRSCI